VKNDEDGGKFFPLFSYIATPFLCGAFCPEEETGLSTPLNCSFLMGTVYMLFPKPGVPPFKLPTILLGCGAFRPAHLGSQIPQSDFLLN